MLKKQFYMHFLYIILVAILVKGNLQSERKFDRDLKKKKKPNKQTTKSLNFLFFVRVCVRILLTRRIPCSEPTVKVTAGKQRAACSDTSQPFWLRGARALQSRPFWGLGSCQQRAYLAPRACLGSRPCLHGEPELMVLKWRPDGDRGLIAAGAAPSSPPAPAGRLNHFSLSSNLPSILFLPLSARPSPPPRPAGRPSLPPFEPHYLCHRVLPPFFILSPPLPSSSPSLSVLPRSAD